MEKSLTAVSTAYLVLCPSRSLINENLQQCSPPQVVEIHITPNDYSKRFTIGRSVNQNLQISRCRDGKEVISRRHAEIYRRRDGSFYIQDLKTLNGTFINNVKIGDHVLREGDVVQFAGHASVDIGKMLTYTKTDLNLRYRFSTHPPADFITPLATSNKSLNRGESKFSGIKNISTFKEVSSSNETRSSNQGGDGKEKRSKIHSRMSEGSPLLSSISAASSGRDAKRKHENQQRMPMKDNLSGSIQTTNCLKDGNTKLHNNLPQMHSPVIAEADVKHSQYSIVATPTSILDLGTLKQKVSCTLCTQPFVDAVVARCSHGFCRACLEKHLRKGKSSCPICNSPPLRYYKRLVRKKYASASSSSSPAENRPLFYYRSDHLDNIVFLLLETENDGGMELFKSREKEDHDYLRSIGIDPYSNPGLYAEELDERVKDKNIVKMGSGTSSSERRRSRRSNINENNSSSGECFEDGEYSEFSDDSEVIRRKKMRHNVGNSPKKQLCEFCAESDHEFPDCPHRESDSEDNDNDSDDSSFSSSEL